MILTTPLTALAPHTAPPGPRIASIRSISSSGKSNVSHKTPPKVGVYTVRPSTITRSLLLNRPLSPRALMAHVLASICATSNPGTMRSRSGILVAPERAMSAAVITNIAEAVRDIFCSVLDTEVTLVFIRSSRLKLVRSGGVVCDQAGIRREKSIVNGARKLTARTILVLRLIMLVLRAVEVLPSDGLKMSHAREL